MSVRVRPLNNQETASGFGWKIDNNTIYQIDPVTREPERSRDVKYSLDHVFPPESTTAEIYRATTQPLIQKVVNGFNGTVFAYGQTSSGKTHTMRGSAQEPGIIQSAVEEAFALIAATTDREFLIRVSYMEVRAAAQPTTSIFVYLLTCCGTSIFYCALLGFLLLSLSPTVLALLVFPVYHHHCSRFHQPAAVQ